MAFFHKRYHPPGTPPGTLVEAAQASADALDITLLEYDAGTLDTRTAVNSSACVPGRDGRVSWVHVQGHPTAAALHDLAQAFDLHALALEDVLNSGQRPKIEPFDDQLFIVMSLPTMVGDSVEVRQLSLFLGAHFVLSFCDGEHSPFQTIATRLHDAGSRLRARSADFLLYSLLDVAIDQGFPVLEQFGSQMEDLEEQILRTTDGDTLEKIHVIKRELILLRRMLWPQREVINEILRDDHALIRSDTLIYFRDCYDHTIQIMDLLETYRDMSSSMLDIYLSSISNRMNEVMRVLTVIATIFIPLTFIVGVYGMNFDRTAGPWNMPELAQPYGYVMVWLAMIALAAVMLVLFRRRKWL